MKKIIRVLLALTIISVLISSSACSLLSKKNAADQKQSDVNSIRNAEQLITNYFTKVYSKQLKDYDTFNASGTIPDELKEFIAQSTIDLENGNPEIGLNFPRTLYLNGYMLGNYELINDDGKPEIDTTQIGMKDGIQTYYVKINLKAKSVNLDSLINIIALTADKATVNNLSKSLADGNFAVISGVMEKLIKDKTFEEAAKDINSSNALDNIKVQFKYDVQVVNEDGTAKISSCRETDRVNSYLNRLSIFNYGSVDRIPFLNIERQKNSNTFMNKVEKDTFDNESALISSYFTNLCANLNNDKMSLLTSAWNKNALTFKDIIDKGFKATNKNSKNLVDLMDITGEYRTRFQIGAFPILTNIDKINGPLSNLSITIHPGYSEKIKKYIVTFKAPVEKINGMVDGYQNTCSYDYTVTLSGSGDNTKVSGMELDSFIYDN